MRSTDQFKQVGVRENDRNEIKSVEGHRFLAMHLHDNLIKTSSYPF